MVSVKIVLISATSLVGAVSAVPVQKEIDYLSILIPGEGLPTPQELGLTNKDLNKPMPRCMLPSNDNVLKKRSECRQNNTCSLSDSTGCFNDRLSLNETPCQVDGRPKQMCLVGSYSWIGNAEGVPSASSYCRDVAHGGNAVNNDSRFGDRVGGSKYAGGNGNLKVNIAG
ncbi:hypothetical protein H072_8761 [Dactylellina haptotyla CBS 200.50]|uniref:Uncharacterized protein n=1 Tax=Dactylellina haptotyla (strain CBS 200.50) TaxID=1284197 RepID=S8A8Q3_DACHA|nr:hypothetical protein H072_8761 [Dactylellina haptotyla CBS 200.50]